MQINYLLLIAIHTFNKKLQVLENMFKYMLTVGAAVRDKDMNVKLKQKCVPKGNKYFTKQLKQ